MAAEHGGGVRRDLAVAAARRVSTTLEKTDSRMAHSSSEPSCVDHIAVSL